MKIAGAVVLASLVLLSVRWQPGLTATNDPKTETVVDASGNLRVPGDYRTAYQSLGSWAVAADQGQGAKEIHVVYASPGTIAAYRKNGHFADGSVLVKEVFEATTGGMTTGTVSHAQTLKGWFVLVKYNKSNHPGNKLWGNGWGWSWFDASQPTRTTSTDFKKDCLSCHVPAQATDWIYTQGYPALKK
jgi:Cytochrome P460